MEAKLFKLLTADKSYVGGYYWKSEKETVGSVVLVHGMAEHSARYDAFAKFLNANGYDVFSLDHIGHGLNSNIGIWEKDTFEKCVDNLRLEIGHVISSSKPVYLFGHSMGSYMVQYYLEKYGDSPWVDKVILSGTSGPRGAFKLGKSIAELTSKIKSTKKKARLINIIAFGNFNAKVKRKERYTPFAWLSSDRSVQEDYLKDPLCGVVPSLGFFCSFFSYLTDLQRKENRLNTPKNVPIFIMGGDKDPVTVYGKGMQKLHQIYTELEISVEMKIYKDKRHEVLNDFGKEEAYNDILKFISKK